MDAELIGRAQHGDEEAFASLAVAAGDRLHAVAHRILRDIELAEDATTPVRITLGGFSGKYLDLQIPADISACTNGYWPWEPGFYAQGPSQRWHLWILDVSGTRVVLLTTDYAGTSAADRAALQAIVDSIQIQP